MTKTSDSASRRVPVGSWGGEHISLQVAESKATFELDCAHGTIDEPLQLNNSNRFDARGVFVRERGGPVHVGQTEDSRPARFTGWTDGQKMTLTITLTDGEQVVGEFTLELGREPRLMKCL